MRLDRDEVQALQLGVLNEWKQTRSLILFEMLKQVAEPLVQNEIAKYRDSGVRQEDLRSEAEALLRQAFDSYSPAKAESLVLWIQASLSALGKSVNSLRAKALAQRGK